MSVSADQLSQKLQQDLFNELLTTNQLLQLISQELHEINQMVHPGGELEANIVKNAALVKMLADLQQLDLDKLPPLARKQIDLNHSSNQSQSHENHDTFRNNSTMDESR